MPLYLTIACLLLSYMYECSLVNLLMEEIKIKKKKKKSFHSYLDSDHVISRFSKGRTRLYIGRTRMS